MNSSREAKKRWSERNPELAKAARREWTNNNRDRVRAYGRKSARKNRARLLAYDRTERGKEVKWANRIKLRHGLTREQYRNLIESQGGCCAGCGERLTSRRHTHVDHDHTLSREEGNIRGVLCSHCNRALGAVRDRPEVLLNLARYLKTRMCGA